MGADYLKKTCGDQFWDANQNQAPFVDSTIPAYYIADYIWVTNPAVPLGRSRMVWNPVSGAYVPPAGELIAQEGNYQTVLASLALPGTNANVVFTGIIIPDYMVPDGLKFGFSSITSMRDSVTATGGGSVGGTLSSASPIITSSGQLLQYSRIQIGNASAAEWGACLDTHILAKRIGTNIKSQYKSWTLEGQNISPTATVGTFSAGAMAARFAARGQITQTASVWAYEIVSHGGV